MRSPLRWKLRTLMVIVALAGLCFAGIALRRRTVRYRELAQEFDAWEKLLPESLAIFDEIIEMDRSTVDSEQRALRVIPEQLGPNWGVQTLANLKQRIEVRKKFLGLQVECRRRQRRYSYAARHPWITVSAGPSVDPIYSALGDEFFAIVPAAPDFATPTALSPPHPRDEPRP